MTNPPMIRELPLACLIVDPDVQRALDPNRVANMVKHFRRDAVGVIVVSQRDDSTYHVIDGQHRVAALGGAGHENDIVTCQVYLGLTRADEAAMFNVLNNTRRVHAVDQFRVRVIAEDPTAVTINTLLEKHGWKVRMGAYDGCFVAVNAIEKIYKTARGSDEDKAANVELLIRVITEAWHHKPAGMHNTLVAGIGAVINRYGDRVDTVKLVSSLAGYAAGPRGLVGHARGLKNFRGGLVNDSVADIVVELLNKWRRTGKLPEWRSS